MKLKQAPAYRIIITLVRVAIGWHFLYEGIVKLVMGDWSSQSFLENATGFMSGFYHWLASGEALVRVVDILNVTGLILIGLALFLGLLTRAASVGGILLLVLYYFAYPPFGTSLFGAPGGHFFIVNINLIESLVLMWFVINPHGSYGLDGMLLRKKPGSAREVQESVPGEEEGIKPTRREVLRNLASLPFLGAMGWGAFRHANNEVDMSTGATVQLDFSSLSELKGELPAGKIGEHRISRLVAGGNLIGGWAHSRDLRYVSSLFKAYNTERKVFETLMLAEQAGINSINIGFPTNALMAKYKKATGSKICVISQVAPIMKNEDYYSNIDKAIDLGADIIQIQGNQCDWLVEDGRMDVIQKMMDHIRGQGYTAGLASHTIDALEATEAAGILPDYYMKTMHHDNYWSAHPIENRVPYEVDGKKNLDHNLWHDNCFCLFPDRTVDFVNRATVPVMGYKVLAAGAIEPEDGFEWAFRNGADFICVGMFDFQIVKDVNITLDVLKNLQGRTRPVYGGEFFTA